MIFFCKKYKKEIAELKKELTTLYKQSNDKSAEYREENLKLRLDLESAKRDAETANLERDAIKRKQTEADLLMVSLKITKSLLEGVPKSDLPLMRNLELQEALSRQLGVRQAGPLDVLGGFGSLLSNLGSRS